MPSKKRLRSLDEFIPLPWHRRRPTKLLSIPIILGIVLAASVGALIGLNL